ncbi:SDR family NAD(P)-dependent oxidoreductase [Desertimonas flava]|uniref:SDR family NAD(P)-dependent oxidoreductase n=1 Tax=Desertimonas flava TaxID=2064846 RepID=UPI000E350019|nr:SDR family oxidoreductase [Desertimonas flava]
MDRTAHTDDLAGRVALVTGANSGIGAATAIALAAHGASVLVTFLRLDVGASPGTPDAYGLLRARGADAVIHTIRTAGGTAAAVEADLADPAMPASLLDTAERELGPVDILVNNASGWRQDSFAAGPGGGSDGLGRSTEAVTAASFDANFAVDARASALLIAEFGRRLASREGTWGRIVGLTSGTPRGFPGEASYGAAKAALENYTMTASIELAPLGVTANVVHPPVTDTGWVTDAVREFVAASHDHHHVADPADVAEVIAWLCSPASWLVTGNIIRLR